jgi:hypothetical protein
MNGDGDGGPGLDSPEQVYEETKAKILGCALGGGLILASSSSIDNGVLAAN